MSALQTLRAFVSERLALTAEAICAAFHRRTAEYEEELRRSEKENRKKQQLLDLILSPRVLLHRLGSGPGLKQETTMTRLEIKLEPEEQLPVSDMMKNNDEDCSDAQMETEADGNTQLSTQSRSAPATAAHDGDEPGPPQAAERKGHQCSLCNTTFTQKSHLKRHTHTVQTGEKLYGCSTCQRQFARKDLLYAHNRTHSGDKPFSCSTCNKSFAQNQNLTAHRRTHTGDKPFSCSTCNKSFAQNQNLTAHNRTHTGDKPFSCSTCNKTFARKSHLKSHMGTHRKQNLME